ncbi:xylulose kinase [Peptococcaceae bacterium CEB3]|nr:xylulose kinase [Peptococcaceae bacterium CEB3]
MEYLVGVDVGTTSTKAIAFGLDGRPLRQKSIEYPIENPFPSHYEQDPETVFAAVLNSVKAVAGQRDEDDLLGIAFSSAMHSVIAVDRTGTAMTHSIIWADTRSKEYADTLKNSQVGHRIYLKTGTPIHPMSPLCKLAWIKEHEKDIFHKAYRFIGIKEFILLKMFGQYIVDYSIASATGLFDLSQLTWDGEALAYLGIDADRLSLPVPATHMLTGIRKEYAEYMAIPENTPFIVGASDGCLANLGADAIRPGYAAVTIGTSGAIRVVANKPADDEKERLFSYVLTKGRYVLGGSVNNGGIALRWFRDTFAQAELNSAGESGVDPYDLLTAEAQKIVPGSDGLIFLPYLLGERAPHWDANAKAVFFGINMAHTRQHFLRAVLEGVTFGLYSIGQALEEVTGKIQLITASGGFARSEFWVQMLADMFNTRVRLAESYESSCFGAAVMGMNALGVIEDLEDVDKLLSFTQVFEPDRVRNEIYQRNFAIFERIYGKLRDEFTKYQ